MSLQTILGANGVIGVEVSRALSSYTDRIRQVSRSPSAVNPTDELVAADLLDARATRDAVAGSDVAYLLAGLQYSATVWEEQWPKVMRNVIDACKTHGTRLVFFDNVYAYGHVEGVMTEDSPFRPSSRKGAVRAKIATTLLEEMASGEIRAMIVRAADFYGPAALQSLTHSTVFDRLRKGKTPQWLGDARKLHSFTYTPDAGRATALLGNTDDAYGRTWHLPTSREAMTPERFVRIAAEAAGRPYGLQVAPRWMMRGMGLFVPVLKESMEMMYQLEHDYIFDSSRIESAMGVSATPYADGIAATWAWAKEHQE